MTTQTLPAAAVPTSRPGFDRTLLSEWTKIRSVRSTLWSLILLVVLSVGLTSLFAALEAANWAKVDASQKASILRDPTGFFLGSGLSLGQLTICVLGVMVIAAEYTTGMIRSSLLAVPRRLRMLSAKAVVFGLLVLVIGEVVSFAEFFVGSAILGSHVDVSLGDSGVLRAVIGGGLYLAMLGEFALAIGALVRNTAVGITISIGWVLVLEPLTGLLPGDWGKHVHAYLPTQAGQLLGQSHRGTDDLLGPWQGYGVFALWTALLLVIAGVLLVRRDA